jgi:hypothetical protein
MTGAPDRCSFCSKHAGEVERMIAGPAAFICNECVMLCVDILKEPPEPPPGLAPGQRDRPPQVLVKTPDGTVHVCEQQTTWVPFDHKGRRLEWCVGRGFIRSETQLRVVAVRDPMRAGPSIGAAYPLDAELSEDDAKKIVERAADDKE